MSFIPPVISLQSFEAVARRRSFALAAAELHVTVSAVSHQVAKLESNLGVRLFERSAHGVRISIAGLWLMSRLHAFAQAYPDIDLRYGVPNWPDLVVEPLFVESIVPLASPAFIRKHRLKSLRICCVSKPSARLSLAGHRCGLQPANGHLQSRPSRAGRSMEPARAAHQPGLPTRRCRFPRRNQPDVAHARSSRPLSRHRWPKGRRSPSASRSCARCR